MAIGALLAEKGVSCEALNPLSLIFTPWLNMAMLRGSSSGGVPAMPRGSGEGSTEGSKVDVGAADGELERPAAVPNHTRGGGDYSNIKEQRQWAVQQSKMV